jgi:hypothetical protein
MEGRVRQRKEKRASGYVCRCMREGGRRSEDSLDSELAIVEVEGKGRPGPAAGAAERRRPRNRARFKYLQDRRGRAFDGRGLRWVLRRTRRRLRLLSNDFDRRQSRRRRTHTRLRSNTLTRRQELAPFLPRRIFEIAVVPADRFVVSETEDGDFSFERTSRREVRKGLVVREGELRRKKWVRGRKGRKRTNVVVFFLNADPDMSLPLPAALVMILLHLQSANLDRHPAQPQLLLQMRERRQPENESLDVLHLDCPESLDDFVGESFSGCWTLESVLRVFGVGVVWWADEVGRGSRRALEASYAGRVHGGGGRRGDFRAIVRVRTAIEGVEEEEEPRKDGREGERRVATNTVFSPAWKSSVTAQSTQELPSNPSSLSSVPPTAPDPLLLHFSSSPSSLALLRRTLLAKL